MEESTIEADVALHDKMVMLVERMLDLNKKKAAGKNPDILDPLETQFRFTAAGGRRRGIRGGG